MKSYTQEPKNHYFNYFYKNKKNKFTRQEEVGQISLPPLYLPQTQNNVL